MSAAFRAAGWPSARAGVLAQVIEAVAAPRSRRGPAIEPSVPEGDRTAPPEVTAMYMAEPQPSPQAVAEMLRQGDRSMSRPGGADAGSVAGARRHISRIPDEEEAKIAALAAEGASVTEASKRLGRPAGTVKRLYWERGLTSVARDARTKRNREVVRGVATGDRSLNDIRRILREGGVSLSRPRIRSIVADLGLPHWQQPSPPPPEVATTILERARSGQFRRSVARETGTTVGQVARVLKKAVEAGRLTSRKTDRPWSRSDVAALDRLGRDGATHRAIGDRLGRTAGAVSSKLHEIGKASPTGETVKRKLRRWTAADIADAKDRRRRGESPAEIALALGRSERSVKDMLARSSTDTAPDRWSAVETIALARLHTLGVEPGKMAHALDRPLSSVNHRLATLRHARGNETRADIAPADAVERAEAMVPPWTDEETALLLRFNAAALPPEVIATALGRQTADIGARLLELSEAQMPRARPPAPGGRRRRTFTEDQLATLRRNVGERLSLAECARSLGASVAVTKRLISTLPLDEQVTRPRCAGWSAGDVAKLVRLRREGRSYGECAVSLGRSRNAVGNRLHRLSKAVGSRDPRFIQEHPTAPQFEAGVTASAIVPNSAMGRPSRKWSPAEDAILLHYRGELRSHRDCAELLRRSVESCRNRLWSLTRMKQVEVSRPSVRTTAWSPTQDAKLIRAWNHGKSAKECAKIVGKSASIIRGRTAKLKMAGVIQARRPHWSAKQDAALAELIEQRTSVRNCAAALGRSVKAITKRLPALRQSGLLEKSKYVPWTAGDEASLLAMLCDGKSLEICATALGRSVGSTRGKAKRLGKHIYGSRGAGRGSTPSMAMTSRPAGLTSANPPPPSSSMAGEGTTPWTPADDKALLDLRASKTTHTRCAALLGRTVSACRKRLGRLKPDGSAGSVTYAYARSLWSDQEELQLIRLRSEGSTCRQCSTALGRSFFAIQEKLRCMRRQGRVAGPRAQNAPHHRHVSASPPEPALERRPPTSGGEAVSRPSLMDRLRRRAEAERQRAKDAAFEQGVRTFVRLHLREVMELKTIAQSWDGVAAALAEEGLLWKSGANVTGRQLSALVSEVTRAERRKAPRIV